MINQISLVSNLQTTQEMLLIESEEKTGDRCLDLLSDKLCFSLPLVSLNTDSSQRTDKLCFKVMPGEINVVLIDISIYVLDT